MLTYGDGLADININDLCNFHKSSGREATVTAVQPPGRFGALDLQEGIVTSFSEKPVGDRTWISGGYFVLERSVLSYIRDDTTVWEQDPLNTLAQNRQLASFPHRGFWMPMDTLRDRTRLESLWSDGTAPWRVW